MLLKDRILLTEDVIIIDIPCNPVPWKAHSGFGRRSFNPLWREREYYQEHIRRQYNGPLIKSAIEVEYIYYSPLPKALSKKKRSAMLSGEIRPVKRPDLDNLNKFMSDCLQKIVFEDDSQIVLEISRKYYSESGNTVIKILTI